MSDRQRNFLKIQGRMYVQYMAAMLAMIVFIFVVLPYGLHVEVLADMNMSTVLVIILTILGSVQFTIATQIGLTGGFTRQTQFRQLMLVFVVASVVIAVLYFGLIGGMHALNLHPRLFMDAFARHETGLGSVLLKWVVAVLTFFSLHLLGVVFQMFTVKMQTSGHGVRISAIFLGFMIMLLVVVGMVIAKFTIHAWQLQLVLGAMILCTALLLVVVHYNYRRFDLPRK